jgi:hypothetical protein
MPSSTERRFRVTPWISLTSFSEAALCGSDFCLIFHKSEIFQTACHHVDPIGVEVARQAFFDCMQLISSCIQTVPVCIIFDPMAQDNKELRH